MKKETKYLFNAVSINLIIASLMFLFILQFDFKDFFRFISNLILNLSVGVLGLYLVAFLIGERLFLLKCRSSKYRIWHGILAIFCVLFFGTLIGSTVGFIQEGLPDGSNYCLKDELFDYYYKPFFWIMLFGFLPTLISGCLLGYHLKKIY